MGSQSLPLGLWSSHCRPIYCSFARRARGGGGMTIGMSPAGFPQTGRSSGAPASGSTPPILVVDDDPALREMMGIILISEGYEVQTCKSGNEAIHALHAAPHRHRILILDMTMADGTGLDVLAWLAEHAELAQRTRVVV